MEHSTENLEHFSSEQTPQEPQEHQGRPLSHRILSWMLIIIVLFGFLGTCYWLAFYGRV